MGCCPNYMTTRPPHIAVLETRGHLQRLSAVQGSNCKDQQHMCIPSAVRISSSLCETASFARLQSPLLHHLILDSAMVTSYYVTAGHMSPQLYSNFLHAQKSATWVIRNVVTSITMMTAIPTGSRTDSLSTEGHFHVL